MAGRMRHTLVVRNPETLTVVALLAGDEVPDWATDLVHEDDLTDGAPAKSSEKPDEPDETGEDEDGESVQKPARRRTSK